MCIQGRKRKKERGERLSASFRTLYRLPEKILKIVKDPDVAGWTNSHSHLQEVFVLEFFFCLRMYSHVIPVMYARSPPDGLLKRTKQISACQLTRRVRRHKITAHNLLQVQQLTLRYAQEGNSTVHVVMQSHSHRQMWTRTYRIPPSAIHLFRLCMIAC